MMAVVLYVHTDKAIKARVPGEQVPHERRLYVVTGSDLDHIIAWKCTITSKGIGHPSSSYIPQPVNMVTLAKFKDPKNRCGSSPTAFFKPDSFYKRIGILELRSIIKAMPNKLDEGCPHCGRPY